MAATYEGDPQIIVWGTDWAFTFELYEQDGTTPLAIDGTSDGLELRIWATDGAAPDILATKSSTPSVITVTTAGSAGVTAAEVLAKLAASDTDGLTVGTQYFGELRLIDASDSNREKSLVKFPVTIVGTAT